MLVSSPITEQMITIGNIVFVLKQILKYDGSTTVIVQKYYKTSGLQSKKKNNGKRITVINVIKGYREFWRNFSKNR